MFYQESSHVGRPEGVPLCVRREDQLAGDRLHDGDARAAVRPVRHFGGLQVSRPAELHLLQDGAGQSHGVPRAIRTSEVSDELSFSIEIVFRVSIPI